MDGNLCPDGPHRAEAGHDSNVGLAWSALPGDGPSGAFAIECKPKERQASVLQVENCQVTANVRTVRNDQSEYHAVQVAASDKSPKNVTKQMMGHFNKAGVSPKRIVKEFPVSADAHVPVGAYSAYTHRCDGTIHVFRDYTVVHPLRSGAICGCYCQLVEYTTIYAVIPLPTSRSIGKGFQGTMKRWNFKGLRASHGVSISHRSAGAIGAHQVRPPASHFSTC